MLLSFRNKKNWLGAEARVEALNSIEKTIQQPKKKEIYLFILHTNEKLEKLYNLQPRKSEKEAQMLKVVNEH